MWRAARIFGGRPDEYLDFSANINPLGPPAAVWEALQGSLGEIVRYPEPQAERLAAALAAQFGLEAEQVVAGNGATELIDRLPLLPGVERVVVVQPTFGEYEEAARRWSRPIVRAWRREETGFVLGSREGQALAALVRPGDLVFLCRPNNPTGGCEPDGEFFALLEDLCGLGATPVVDESFLGFAAGASTALPLLRLGLPVIVVLSLTKLYALPGLRLGCVFAQAPTAQALAALLPPWRVNALAAAAGRACLEDREFVIRTQRQIGESRAHFAQALGGIDGVEVFPSAANFLLVRIAGTGLSSSELRRALAGRRILVRDARSFPGLGERFIRVAVRRDDENERLVAALREVLRTGR